MHNVIDINIYIYIYIYIDACLSELAISQWPNSYLQSNLANQIFHMWHHVSQKLNKMALWLAKIFGGSQNGLRK